MSGPGSPGGPATPLGSRLRTQPKRDRAGLRYLVRKRGDPGGDAIALTFDDGPVDRTAEIADILEAGGARGTFFMVGEKVPGHERLLRRMIEAGHEIGNHSYHHQIHPSIRDIASTSALLGGVTGVAPRSYRPPFGAIDRPTALSVRETGMTPVNWDVDSEDVFPMFQGLEPSKVYDNIVGRARPGSIVLLHDGSPWSRAAEVLPDIITTLTEKGFRLVTVSELLAELSVAEERELGNGAETAGPRNTPRPESTPRSRGWRVWRRPRGGAGGPALGRARPPVAHPATRSQLAELEAMKPKQVLDLLESRQATSEGREAGPDGWGLTLAARVALNPAAFARLADRFMQLDAGHLRWVIAGLAGAAKRGRALDWDAALTLLEATLPPQGGAGDGGEDGARLPDWAARAEAAQFILAALVVDMLPLAFADRVWEILERLSWDREAGLDLQGEPSRPHEVRVQALRATIRYAVWRKAKSEEVVDLTHLPRVRETLDAHLDPAREPHEGIWGVYGSELGWLQWIDAEWLGTRIEAILPNDPRLWKLRRAGWAGHLLYGSASGDLLPLLEDEYRRAVRELPTPAHLRRGEHSDPGRALVRHLAELYWTGDVDLSEDGLMRALVERADPGELAYLVKSLGLWSDRDDLILDEEVRLRLTRLWEIVLERVLRHGSERAREVLVWFGVWYAQAELDPAWSDAQITAVLEQGVVPEPVFRVLERAASRARAEPRAAVDVAARCLALVGDEWEVYSARENLHAVADAALASEDPAVERQGRRLEDELEARVTALREANGLGDEQRLATSR